MNVPFFRPSISEAEIAEVVSCLRSGWLTTGPIAKRFETAFAEQVGAKHAAAVNSCTAALHLAVEALGLAAGQAVLVPTMTFAATAEIVRYCGAVPILVDCDPVTTNMDLEDAARKIEALRVGRLPGPISRDLKLVGMIPVHVGGLMMDVARLQEFAAAHGLWLVDDAAHAFPAAWRAAAERPWQRCGEATAAVSCYSFYANKTITTGEGGMAVTDDAALADRMRLMSLHGLSHDAWNRYSGGSSWDYRIMAPGYKYNMTDIAAALGVKQLERAESLRADREKLAARYLAEFADVAELELPPTNADRIHAWHLFPIRLRLERLSIDRNQFVAALRERQIGCSVHWRPLHLHPYYAEHFGWQPEHCSVATQLWERLVTLPLFPGMRDDEQSYVIKAVRELCGTVPAMMKRLFDVLVATVGLLLLWPLFLIAAIAIRCTSRGPVFFRQERIGRNFQPFRIIKFRTMVVDAPKLGAQITAGDDPRITRVGRFLRRWKFDELPQMINVLKGEMSVVGPRPEVPRYVEMYRDDYASILSVRPGITDPASLKYRDEEALLAASDRPEQTYIERILPDKIALAKEYVARNSLGYDISVLWKTFWLVFG